MDDKDSTKSEQQSRSQTKQENPVQINNPITRKLNKILESRIENDKVC